VSAAPVPSEVLVTVATALSAAATAATVFLGTRFVDVQRAAIQVAAVEFADGTIAFGVVAHFDKAKTSGLPGIAVGDDADAIDLAVRFK